MGLQEFEEYCRLNANVEHDKVVKYIGDDLKHNRFVQSIFDQPHLIGLGIRNIASKYKEVNLQHHGNNSIGCIDIVFFASEVYICELKISLKRDGFAESQVKKGYEFIRDSFGVISTRIVLRGDNSYKFDKKIIRPNIEDILAIANRR